MEDAEVAGFGVADLLDALVGCVEEAGLLDNGGVEGFDAGLVEGEDNPLGAEEVLEEYVVAARWSVGCVEDGAGDVGREWRVKARVGTVD